MVFIIKNHDDNIFYYPSSIYVLMPSTCGVNALHTWCSWLTPRVLSMNHLVIYSQSERKRILAIYQIRINRELYLRRERIKLINYHKNICVGTVYKSRTYAIILFIISIREAYPSPVNCFKRCSSVRRQMSNLPSCSATIYPSSPWITTFRSSVV